MPYGRRRCTYSKQGGIIILRVIAGEVKGHRLKTVKGDATRPTADRVKESLFNILAPYLEGGEVLDLFAGTGNLGIEALSRGAVSAVFVDRSAEACSVIRENIAHTKMQERSAVFNLDFTAAASKLALERRKFDIVFLDPPYCKNFIQETLKILIKNDIIRYDGILAAEHHIADPLPERTEGFETASSRRYGETAITIYRRVI